MKNRTGLIVLLLLVVGALLVTGCSSSGGDNDGKGDWSNPGSNENCTVLRSGLVSVYRCTDPQTGVTCYMYSGEGKGIDCLPASDVDWKP